MFDTYENCAANLFPQGTDVMQIIPTPDQMISVNEGELFSTLVEQNDAIQLIQGPTIIAYLLAYALEYKQDAITGGENVRPLFVRIAKFCLSVQSDTTGGQNLISSHGIRKQAWRSN